MNKSSSQLIFAALLTAVLSASIGSAGAAEGQWKKDHPRRAEFNQRLKNQDKRIHREVKDGQISRQQAGAMHREDHQIRQEERSMASQNGGHITRQEQRTLNQQENGVSRQIGR